MHWGGGTLNLLDERQLERAFRLVADRFHFTDDAELSVEADSRLATPELVHDVCASARAAGFDEINIDLIYGLPRQTAEPFGRTLALALALEPDRVACFSYAHLPAQRVHQRVIDADELPDADTRATLFQQAVAAFVGADYAWIGLDHFARASDPLAVAQREGRLHHNFMGYTTMSPSHVVGVGMSAITDAAGGDPPVDVQPRAVVCRRTRGR